MLNWFKRNHDRSFGNPLYNLRIQLALDKETFEVRKDTASTDLYRIVDLAELINFAFTNLEGSHLVTDKGAILRPNSIHNRKYLQYVNYSNTNYPWFDAHLFINRNIRAMNKLVGAFTDKEYHPNEEELIELEYEKPEGFKQQIYTKDGMLWTSIERQNPLINQDTIIQH